MKRWILYILLGLIVFFIWDNSMQNGGSSDGFSLLFAETFVPIANELGFHGNIWILNRIVRKLAHLTEFTILGSVLYAILRQYITYGTVIKTIGLGMLIACLDEFIQLFSPGRSSQFSDILIDTVGVVIGILVVKLVYYIRYKRRTFKN
ncbi:VanZ family protein [Veillonella sp. 20925_1_51]|uniref:VanZ family protein n=1 Tax=Veillonella sp. 20925_1_51 TaxID=3003641 RepID=UPI00352C57BC